jgi:hypothetical protein
MKNRRKLQHNTPGENELIEVLSYTNGIAGPESCFSWLGMPIAQRGNVARSLNSTQILQRCLGKEDSHEHLPTC